MKKILLAALSLLVALSLLACNGEKEKKDISELFDEKPSDVKVTEDQKDTQTDTQTPSANSDSNADVKSDTEIKDTEDKESEEEKTEPESEEKKEDSQEKNADFTLSDSELQTIKSRYIEAEDFYYTMLYQQLELDSYDVIVRKNSDGYDTEYHRLIYYGVNSLADLKSFYREYFTSDFVNSLDFSMYIEDGGKLYCAQTENTPAASGVKYIYSAKGIDEENAYVVRSRTDGGSSQKISCIKEGGVWYFGGVAIS